MMKGGAYHDMFIPLRMIEALVGELRKRKVLIDRACANSSVIRSSDDNSINHNPWLKYKWNQAPEFLSSDIYLFPVITWCSILVAQTESRLLAYSFNDGLKIEKGDVIPVFAATTNTNTQPSLQSSERENADGFLEMMVNAHKQALAIIDACQFSTLSPHTTVATAAKGLNDITFQDSSQISVASGSLAGVDSVNSDIQDAIASSQQQLPLAFDMTIEQQVKDSVDMTIAKDEANSMQLLLLMNTCTDPVNLTVSNAALKVLKNHGIDVDPNTAQFAVVQSSVASTVSSQSPNKKGKKSRGGKGSIDLSSPKGGSAAPASPAKASPKVSRATSANPTGSSAITSPQGQSGKSSPKHFKALATAVAAFTSISTAGENISTPPEPVLPPYVPNQLDKISSRSELMPYIEKFGRDEVAAYIQWSIANMSGGLSLGTFGQSMASAQELLTFVEHEKSQLVSSNDETPLVPPASPSHPTTPSAKTRAAAAALQERILPRTQEFLREVRGRLSEIDSKLSLQLHAGYTEVYFKVYGNEPILDPNDQQHAANSLLDDDGDAAANGSQGEDSNQNNKIPTMTIIMNKFAKIDPFPIGLLESHVIIVMLLMKLSSQLGMKQEVETHINHYERMSTLLYYRKPYSLDAQVYYALSFRWRLDLLEWLTDKHLFDLHADDHQRHQLYFSQFLPIAKKYYLAAKKIGSRRNIKNHDGINSSGGGDNNSSSSSNGDYHILKDAIKRLINVYLVIHRDSASPNGGSDHRSTGSNSILSAQSVTMEDLMYFGKESIDYYEESDLDWVRKYGKLRAMQYMAEMKEVSRKCVL